MRRITPVFATLVALCLYATASSAEAPALRTITTAGHGLAKAKADTAVVQMQTSTLNKSASASKQIVDQMINKALAALDEMNIERDHIVASTIRLVPDYQYDNRERTFSGYQATRGLTVTLDDLDKLDDLLEAMTGAGINNVLSINLKSSKEQDLKEKALAMAIEDSKAKAGKLAAAYGAELGNIHTITYMADNPIVYQEQAPMAMLKSADQSGGEYVHDKISVEDRIQVVFELIIPH